MSKPCPICLEDSNDCNHSFEDMKIQANKKVVEDMAKSLNEVFPSTLLRERVLEMAKKLIKMGWQKNEV